VTISRANKSLQFPCRFIMVAAMNPSPSGGWNDAQHSTHQMQRYLSKLSGPLLDRIDLHLEVPDLPANHLIKEMPSETSLMIKERTTRARQRQIQRLGIPNAQMSAKQIKKYCELTPEGRNLLFRAIEELKLSARAYDRILKVARTIADLAGDEQIQTAQVAEAIQYRSLDRRWT